GRGHGSDRRSRVCNPLSQWCLPLRPDGQGAPMTAALATTAAPAVAAHLDPRLAAFCSPSGVEVFSSIVYQPQVWTPDPFDVEEIHREARQTFDRLLNQAILSPQHGRVMLLLGEAGSGKTHLMRAFRNRAHEDGNAYCGYLQMTTPASNYA